MAFVRSRARTPYAVGAHDCALFAMDGVREMTGEDLAAPHRGYSDEAQAAAAIAAFTGGGTMEQVAEKIFAEHQLEEIAPAFAQRGDVVLLDPSLPTHSSLGGIGLCLGAVAVFAVPPAGHTSLPMKRMSRAWRIE